MDTRIINKIQKLEYFPSLFHNVFGHAIHQFCVLDINKFIFCTKNFKMAAVYKMAPKMEVKLENGIVSLFFKLFGQKGHEGHIS